MKVVSRYQELEPAAIDALKELLDMKTIFRYQELSDHFVLQNIKEIEADDETCDALVLNHNGSPMTVNVVFRRWVLLYLRSICKKLSNDVLDACCRAHAEREEKKKCAAVR